MSSVKSLSNANVLTAIQQLLGTFGLYLETAFHFDHYGEYRF